MESVGEAALHIFEKTIDTFRDITIEIPGARSLAEAANIVLKKDRKMYVGVILLFMAALAMIAAS